MKTQTKEAQPEISKQAEFLEKGYKVGQIFHRTNNDKIDLKCSVFTGSCSENSDGIVMSFVDRRHVLSDFCTLQTEETPEIGRAHV